MPTKSPCCAICVDRTRGRTREVRLTHGVSVWLCDGHASLAFQTQRSGRDFVRTLSGVWKANGCYTVARHKALHSHLARLTEHPPRPRPGSYAWPELRRRLERRYAEGVGPDELAAPVHRQYARCPAHPPSLRTLQRWHAQRRWLVDRPP